MNPKSMRVLVALLLLQVVELGANPLQYLGTSEVDAKALTFARGPATRFGPTVNGRTHQQSPLTTYRAHQYATYVDAARRICVARRKLPDGAWEVIRFNDYRFKSNDSHNTAVLGICDNDGTIHLAFDHHASPLNYRISKPGVAHDPGKHRWNASLFGEVMHRLGSVTTDKKVTYPRFIPTPNGNLLFYYRSVTSGNGHGMIEEYNGSKHDWTPGLGKFIARDLGTFTDGDRSSQFRCPYLDSISYAGQRLHVSWVWRDRFEKTSVRNQHDLCYAYSDDHGRTWKNTSGKVIGRTGKSPMRLGSPGLVVADIPTNSGLSNQNTHYAYPDGSIHMVHLRRAEGSKRNVYHHHWRTPDGKWKHQALPYTGSRPKLVGDPQRNLFLIFEARDELRIAVAKPTADGWRWKQLSLPNPPSVYGEPLLDLPLWQQSQVLSVYCHAAPAKTISTDKPQAVDGAPSPLHIIDFRNLPTSPKPPTEVQKAEP